MGVVALNISLTALMDEIEAASPLEDGYSILINEAGRIIALPEAGYSDILGPRVDRMSWVPISVKQFQLSHQLGMQWRAVTPFSEHSYL